MTESKKSSVEIAATRLRALALNVDCGSLLGSEDTLIETLGFSRPTVRQAARMLEREGLIRVRRGIGGGYLTARPDISTIEQTVSVYMEMRSVAPEEMTTVTSILWVEAVRRAAAMQDTSRKMVADALHDRVKTLPSHVSLHDITALEEAIRTAIFSLVNLPYIELIFQISETFARRQFPLVSDEVEAAREFASAWKIAKALELDAISRGDPDIAVIGARRVRSLLRQCVLSGIDR